MKKLIGLLTCLILFFGCAGTQVKHRHQDDLKSHALDVEDLLRKYKPKSHDLIIPWNGQPNHLAIAYELMDLSCSERTQYVLRLEKELK
jgi:hypothetical protein